MLTIIMTHMTTYLYCFPCIFFKQKVTVEAPPGKVIGYVSQAWSMCKPRFKIENANEDTVLRIKGPCCTWSICGDIEFDVSLIHIECTAFNTFYCQ